MMGALVGAPVGTLVGNLVGTLVGALVGALVGFPNGALVGLPNGALVGLPNGALVGAFVGAFVGFPNCLLVGALVFPPIHRHSTIVFSDARCPHSPLRACCASMTTPCNSMNELEMSLSETSAFMRAVWNFVQAADCDTLQSQSSSGQCGGN